MASKTPNTVTPNRTLLGFFFSTVGSLSMVILLKEKTKQKNFAEISILRFFVLRASKVPKGEVAYGYKLSHDLSVPFTETPGFQWHLKSVFVLLLYICTYVREEERSERSKKYIRIRERGFIR
jgi:hypothetical protein